MSRDNTAKGGDEASKAEQTATEIFNRVAEHPGETSPDLTGFTVTADADNPEVNAEKDLRNELGRNVRRP